MGKKRIIKKTEDVGEKATGVAPRVSSKRRLTEAVVHVLSTYNNTLITLTDTAGNVYLSQSSGRTGFSGSKKGTPYAASKAAEILADQARELGVTEVAMRIKGVGSGRESALRVFAQKGFQIQSIKDTTPTPHGHSKPTKPRRV
jgi:small subunit ribosomal protein S11